MHSFRLRYVALGLLIYIQSAFSDTCASSLVDLPSRTRFSPAVFEGQAVAVARRLDGTFLVRFSLIKLYKGKLAGVSNGKDGYVVVGNFGVVGGDEDSCVASIDGLNLSSRTSYLVFLNSTGRPSDSLPVDQFDDTNLTNFLNVSSSSSSSSSSRSVFYYTISGFPVNATNQTRTEVEANSSPKTGVAPNVEMTSQNQHLKVGDRLHLQCKVTRGRPKPTLRWFRNGTVLKPDKHLALRQRKQSFTMQIKKSRPSDAGVYHCLATNAAGQKESKKVTIELSDEAHLRRCEEQNYCLHKGTCYVVLTLQKKLCKCRDGFEGDRCQEKTTALAKMRDNKRRLFRRMHGSHS